jgi:hypothetical protein
MPERKREPISTSTPAKQVQPKTSPKLRVEGPLSRQAIPLAYLVSHAISYVLGFGILLESRARFGKVCIRG